VNVSRYKGLTSATGEDQKIDKFTRTGRGGLPLPSRYFVNKNILQPLFYHRLNDHWPALALGCSPIELYHTFREARH
jgi:hypothetical protein